MIALANWNPGGFDASPVTTATKINALIVAFRDLGVKCVRVSEFPGSDGRAWADVVLHVETDAEVASLAAQIHGHAPMPHVYAGRTWTETLAKLDGAIVYVASASRPVR